MVTLLYQPAASVALMVWISPAHRNYIFARVADRAPIRHHLSTHLDDPMLLAKPTALVIALTSVMLLPRAATALSQDIGGISCDVIADYGATTPAYFEVFQAYLEGWLAGEKNVSKLGKDDPDAATLLSAIIEYCKVSRDATFASAVAAVAK
jgi:hypothetical protein